VSPAEPTPREDQVRQVLSYHRRTKHHLHRYAESAGYLDWATQPDPFRTFAGAEAVELPLLADALSVSQGDLFQPGRFAPRRLDVNSLAILFELALGLSAWKQFRGSRWALRCNPSSGNLHPTEGYAVVPGCPGLETGVYHYVSRDHLLERRCALAGTGGQRLLASLSSGTFLIGLSSIHWREAWKYGTRAYRYCQHDAGHAIAAIRFAAATLGWSARLLDGPGDSQVSTILGLDRDSSFPGLDPLEREHPDALLLVGPPLLVEPTLDTEAMSFERWTGEANRLSPAHVRWELIDVAATAASKPYTPLAAFDPPALPPLVAPCSIPAAALIRQRRSCLALDGKTGIDAATLYHLLNCLLPRRAVPPWDVLPWRPQLHPVLFVHRVRGLASGLYILERHSGVHDALQAAFSSEFLWRKPADCPDHLRLFLLAEGDFRERSRTVSCHQEIASDGAFSLGMLAEFGDVIRTDGPWWYRRLFWESGVLGQVLYLEAEAADVRGTGIGCYFDDVFHDLLGLKGDAFQSLYHFTVGSPVDDPRLQTIAPYAHLKR
jgi:SagB-type dehydrogenase family enzyme